MTRDIEIGVEAILVRTGMKDGCENGTGKAPDGERGCF